MKYKGDYAKALPDRLKALRNKAGLSQEQLANATGISIESVRKYEQGRSIPDTNALCTICDFFDCDMDYLFGRYDARKRSTQEIIDCIGLSEAAANVLLLNKRFANLKLKNIPQLLKNTAFIDYIYANNFYENDGEQDVFPLTSFLAMRADSKDSLNLVSTAITNGLLEAVKKYIKDFPENSGLCLEEHIEQENLNAIITILKKMRSEYKEEFANRDDINAHFD